MNVVRRWPVTAFLVIAFGLGWPLLTAPVPLPLAVLGVTLGVLVPAAVVVTGLTEGRAGVRALLGRLGRWRIGAGWWALVLAGVPLLTLALGLAAGGRLAPGAATGHLIQDLAGVLGALLVIHLAEELVWAGFLQTRLSARHGVLRGAVLTALPFAAIHLPLLLLGPFSPRAVVVDAAGLLLLALTLRFAIGFVLAGTGGSVLAAAVLHAVFNAANNSGGPLDHLLADVDHGLVAVVALAVVGALAWAGPRTSALRPSATPRSPLLTTTNPRRPS